MLGTGEVTQQSADPVLQDPSIPGDIETKKETTLI